MLEASEKRIQKEEERQTETSLRGADQRESLMNKKGPKEEGKAGYHKIMHTKALNVVAITLRRPRWKEKSVEREFL